MFFYLALYTEVLFFVAVPQLNFTFKYDEDDANTHKYEQLAVEFTSLAKEQRVQPLLSFGGWTGSLHFSSLTSTRVKRKAFAKALVDYSKRLGFTGLDLDWEYPNGDGVGCNSRSPVDTVNFGLLVKEIRRLWPDGQLTAAIGLNGLVGRDGGRASSLETSLLTKYLDFVNLMAYDVYGNFAPTTGPLAPMHNTCAPDGYNVSVETGVKTLARQGFTADQIVLGLPGYAIRLELVSPKLQPLTVKSHTTYLYQNHTEKTPPGGISDDKPQKDVCGVQQDWGGSWLTVELISKGWLSKDEKTGGNGYTRHFDECSRTPFLTDGKYLITYDDKFSTVRKSNWAKLRNLAGVFFFDTTGPPKSTVHAARKALKPLN